MANHPSRSTASFRFLVFSTIDHRPLAHGATAARARTEALIRHRLGEDDGFLEILDCGEHGRKIWNLWPMGFHEHGLTLPKLRRKHRIAFRGAGYDHLAATPLAE